MAAAKRVIDCRPEPPTPTNNAQPPGIVKILHILERCPRAYLCNYTKI